jgi:hypothetical protein
LMYKECTEEDDSEAIKEAEYKMGCDGTDDYKREVMGKNELTEPDYEE